MTEHSRFTADVNSYESQLYQSGAPDPVKYHIWFDDFDKYTATDWLITTTEAGASSATEALGIAEGGTLVITNDAADNDLDFLQWRGGDAATYESFKFVVGKELWFKTRFKVSDATQSDFVIGLQITDTTALAVSDGVYFRKDDGDTNLDHVIIKDSSGTTSTAVHTMVDDTYITCGFYYNGIDAIDVFVNDACVADDVAVTNMPDDELLTISFGIQNGEAVAKVMTLDYISVVQER